MAIRLPDFRRQELPTTRGVVPAISPTFRPQVTPASQSTFAAIENVGNQVSDIAEGMKNRWEQGRATGMVSKFSTEIAALENSISPSDYGKRGDLVRSAAENLKTQYLSAAGNEGWLPENLSLLERTLTSDVAQAEVRALRTAKGQEAAWHTKNIGNVIDESLRRTENLPFNDSNGIVRQASQNIEQAITAAKGSILDSTLDEFRDTWRVKKENQYMEGLVETDPRRMSVYKPSFSLSGELYRKRANAELAAQARQRIKIFTQKVSSVEKQIQNLGDGLGNMSDAQFGSNENRQFAANSINGLHLIVKGLLDDQPVDDPALLARLKSGSRALTAYQYGNRFADLIVRSTDPEELDRIMGQFQEFASSPQVINAEGGLATEIDKQGPRLTKLIAERKKLIEASQIFGGQIKAIDESVSVNAEISSLDDTGNIARLDKDLAKIQAQLTGEQVGETDTQQTEYIKSRLALLRLERQRLLTRSVKVRNERNHRAVMSGDPTIDRAESRQMLSQILNDEDTNGEQFGQILGRGLLTPEGAFGEHSQAVLNIVDAYGFVPETIANVFTNTFDNMRSESTPQQATAIGNLIGFAKVLDRVDSAAAREAIPSHIWDIVDSVRVDSINQSGPQLVGQAIINKTLLNSNNLPEIRKKRVQELQDVGEETLVDYITGNVNQLSISDDSRFGLGKIVTLVASDLVDQPSFNQYRDEVLENAMLLALGGSAYHTDSSELISSSVDRVNSRWAFTSVTGKRVFSKWNMTSNALPFGGEENVVGIRSQLADVLKGHLAGDVTDETREAMGSWLEWNDDRLGQLNGQPLNEVDIQLWPAKATITRRSDLLDIQYAGHKLEGPGKGQPQYTIYFDGIVIQTEFQPEITNAKASALTRASARGLEFVYKGLRGSPDFLSKVFADQDLGRNLPATAMETRLQQWQETISGQPRIQ